MINVVSNKGLLCSMLDHAWSLKYTYGNTDHRLIINVCDMLVVIYTSSCGDKGGLEGARTPPKRQIYI